MPDICIEEIALSIIMHCLYLVAKAKLVTLKYRFCDAQRYNHRGLTDANRDGDAANVKSYAKTKRPR